jgi:anti-sigma B factor antagonist
MAAVVRRRPSFRVALSDEGGVRLVAVRGEVEVLSAPQLAEALADRSMPVLVDLCEVSFMDSTGLHVLLAAQRRLPALAVVCVPEGAAERVLALSGLDRVLTVFATREEGLAALRGQTGLGSPTQ